MDTWQLVHRPRRQAGQPVGDRTDQPVSRDRELHGAAWLHAVVPVHPGQPLLAHAVHRGRLAARPRRGAVGRDGLAGPPPRGLAQADGRNLMTIFTRAEPPVSRPGRDTGAGLEPVPWRGMLWITWRQQRGLLSCVLAAFAVAVAGL